LMLSAALLAGLAFSMLAPARAQAELGPSSTAPRLVTASARLVYGPLPFSRRPARVAAPGDVVINEVVTDPQTDWSSNDFSGVPGNGTVSSIDEYVELYIKTAGLDLDGWTIALDDGSPSSGDLSSSGAFQVSRYVGPGSFHNTGAGAYLVLGNPQGSSSL